MNVGVTRTDGLPNLNAQPCYDSGFISQNSIVLYSVALPNVSTNSKVLQVFNTECSHLSFFVLSREASMFSAKHKTPSSVVFRYSDSFMFVICF